MKKIKQFIILNLALLIAFSMFPVAAFAEGEETSYPVLLEEGSARLYQYLDDYDYEYDGDDNFEYVYNGSLQGNEVFHAEFDCTPDDYDYAEDFDVMICVENGNGKTISEIYGDIGKTVSLTFGREELGTDDFELTIYNFAENYSLYYYDVAYRFEKYRGYCEYASVTPSLSVKGAKSSTIKVESYGPEDTLYKVKKWTSSNTKIATVNKNGKVTGMQKGSCTVTAHFYGGVTSDCKVTVTTNPAPKINYSKKSLNKGKKLQLKVLYTSKTPKWSTSNKKVATVSKNGKVTAKGIGKCTITAKIGSKTYKCKISVVYRWPDFGAYLYSYNTRGNYFVVKFNNQGTRSVVITEGTKVLHTDYKTYDRKVRLKKKVTIKPGAVKLVRFYVNGTTTWPDRDYFRLYYKFKFDGKVWEARTWDSDSKFKRGGSWEDTYWDEDWYDEWDT